MNNYGFDYFNYMTNVPMDNFYQVNYDQNNQFKNDMGVQKSQLVDPYLGFIRGNLFGNLYDSYKNYKPSEVNSNSEKEALLYQIMQYKFALVDLNLYLDTNPNDIGALNLYRQYLNIEKQMCDKYEKMYGPLSVDCLNVGKDSWNWLMGPWPWEVK